ncbi:MAG: tetratricopeptide repeat protein [Acidobacteria bacterium]|nr:tetratricopeptide repeat protein [Acidobacteriota bacterium]
MQAAAGKHQQAVETLREAVRLEPGYLPARLKLAETLLALGDWRASREIYEAILKKDPASAFAHYGRGRARAAGGEQAEAAEDYRRACELAPNYAVSHYALAQAYRRLGNAALAQEHLARYQKDPLAQPPLDDPLRNAVKDLNAGAQQHLRRGVDLEAAGDLAQSAAEHERALEIDPTLTQAHTNLVTLYGRLGKAAKAEEHYRAAIGQNPNLAEAHYNFGVLLFERGKYREAGSVFRKAVEINPYYAEAHNNLAFVLEHEGRAQEALQHYRAAIENKPNYRLAHFHLGRFLLTHGQSTEAIDHFLQTLTPSDESTPGFMYGLAAAYARTGDRSRALQYMHEARRRAEGLGQTELVVSIDKDLRTLEGER